MRILIAHEAAAGGGGVESYLAAVIPALIARGHDLFFLHHNRRTEPGPTSVAPAGVLSASVADEGLAAAIERIRRWRPDVCFSHNMGPLDVEERLTSEWPVIKMMHGYFGTCISGQKAHAFPRILPCDREFGLPCVALYLPRRCGQLRPLAMFTQFRWASRQRALFERYAHVVVASAHMAAEYGRHDVPAVRLTTARLFPTDGESAPVRPIPSDAVVLFAGRMTNIKGGDVLVRAVAEARRLLGSPIRLVMAGDGPRRQEWAALAARLGVDARFPGWVTGDERLMLFRSASLVAVPSLWPEPFGLVGLEAAVHGVPAVAFDVGGIREWLQDDVGGRLVGARNDAVALGNTIFRMLSSPGELARLGEGARRTALAFTLNAHLEVIEEVFARAVGAKAAAS